MCTSIIKVISISGKPCSIGLTNVLSFFTWANTPSTVNVHRHGFTFNFFLSLSNFPGTKEKTRVWPSTFHNQLYEICFVAFLRRWAGSYNTNYAFWEAIMNIHCTHGSWCDALSFLATWHSVVCFNHTLLYILGLPLKSRSFCDSWDKVCKYYNFFTGILNQYNFMCIIIIKIVTWPKFNNGYSIGNNNDGRHWRDYITENMQ